MCAFLFGTHFAEEERSTVVPAKSDSDVMFCNKVIRDLKSIYHLCINPIRRIG